MESIDLTPQQWLQINYNLKIGNRIVTNKRTGIITNVLKADNIGHFRTKYPVVLVVDYLTEEPQKVTIEEILGF